MQSLITNEFLVRIEVLIKTLGLLFYVSFTVFFRTFRGKKGTRRGAIRILRRFDYYAKSKIRR